MTALDVEWPITSSQYRRISASFAALSPADAVAVRTWWRAEHLPKVEALNHDQADLVIAHLDELESF